MGDKKSIKNKNYGFWAFSPLILFLLLYLGSGMIFSAIGIEKPFKQIPRHTALLAGIILAWFMGKQKFEEKVNIFTKSAGTSGVMHMVLIFLLAGAFSGVTKGMGSVDSVVNLGLTYIPNQFIIAGVFVIGCCISTAMGTSSGTIVAMAPIALGFAEKSGISPAIALAAVAGGAMFGDNLSAISDTTIAATKGVNCEMKDKLKMNFLIAIPAALITIVLYSTVGASGAVGQTYSFELIKVIPYLVVLIAAVVGVNVLIVLLSGITLAAIIGIATGDMTFIGLAQATAGGMDGMMNLSIMALLISGLIGLIKEYGGIEWLVNKLTENVKSRRSAEYSITALVSMLTFALANNTIAIMIAAPIAKQISERYNIASKRVASLLDIFSCVILSVAPHSGGILFVTSITSITPIEFIKYNYYPLLLGVCAIITIQLGLLKTKEEKESLGKKESSVNI